MVARKTEYAPTGRQQHARNPGQSTAGGQPGMNAVDYILDAVLLATVFLQFRGRRLTPRNLLLPIAIVVYFLFAYLKGVPTAGNDLYLIGGGIVLGLIFGV